MALAALLAEKLGSALKPTLHSMQAIYYICKKGQHSTHENSVKYPLRKPRANSTLEVAMRVSLPTEKAPCPSPRGEAQWALCQSTSIHTCFFT